MSAKEFFNTMLKKTNEHSPEILTIGGSLLCIGAGIFVSYQTYKKLPEIMKDHKNRRAEMEDTKKFAEEVVEASEKKTDEHPDEKLIEDSRMYLDKGVKIDLLHVYSKTAVNFLKTYAIPVAVGVAGIVCILSGNRILRARNAELTTALSTVTTAYAAYRKRIQKAIGKEAEERIFRNETVETQKYKDVDDDGNEIEKERTVVKTDNKFDPYALKLDRNSPYYHNKLMDTFTELKILEDMLNDKLIRRTPHDGKGHMIQNEISNILGYEDTRIGAIAGWIHCDDPLEQEKHGDGYISFGLFRRDAATDNSGPLNDYWAEIMRNDPNANTDDYDIWLHFNVDGSIIEYLDEKPGQPI